MAKKKVVKEKKKKILFFDIETSHSLAAIFSLFNDSGIPHSSVITEWAIISIAYKFQGDKKTTVLMSDLGKNRSVISEIDDRRILEKFSKVLNEADVVVGHNSDRFDLKKINTRLIRHKLGPIKPNIKKVDTLKIAKRNFAFMSNRLDYISKYLGYGGKMSTPNGLWIKVLMGDKKAVKIMGEYNARDVEELENVYNELIDYDLLASVKVEDPNRPCCRECGSKNNIVSRKKASAVTGLFATQYQCYDCNKYFTVK